MNINLKKMLDDINAEGRSSYSIDNARKYSTTKEWVANGRPSDIASVLYDYCLYMDKGRWPEAEKFILKDLWIAFYYASCIIGERWPEAESMLLEDDAVASKYAIFVIGDRWNEYEAIADRYEYAWEEYCLIFDLDIGTGEAL